MPSAKAAVVGFTHSLARQVGKHRIRVNAIAPGLVLTEKQQRLWFPTPEKVAEVVNSQFIPDGIMPGRYRQSRAVPGRRRQPHDHPADVQRERRPRA